MNVVTNKKTKINMDFHILKSNFNYNDIIEFIDENYQNDSFILKNKSGHIFAIGDFISIQIPIKSKNQNLMQKNIEVGFDGIMKYDKILVEDEYTNFFYKGLFYYIDSKMSLCIFKNKNINFEIKSR